MGRLSPEIDAAIARASLRTGVPADSLRAFVMIESGGDPNNRTGSYKGLLQLSDQEFARHGGQGNVFDVDANLTAGATKLKTEAADFEKRYGRQPSSSELYLMHQQGVGGSAAHWNNPDAPAWQNMLSTGEGRQKGEGWAKQAIWGNVPDDLKRQYGSVDNLTSRDFVNLWDQKVARAGGGAASGQAPVAMASAQSAVSDGEPAAESPQKADPGMFGSFGGILSALGGGAPEATPSASPFASLSMGTGSNDSSEKKEKDDPLTIAPDPLTGFQIGRTKLDMAQLVKALRARANTGTV